MWVGLTLPGMIDEPGSFAGSRSSPRPLRGPEPAQRMSLAIFIKAQASRRNPPEAATTASCAASAANLFGAETNGNPVSSEIVFAQRSPNSGGAFRPVPTAVPPMASSYRPGSDPSITPIAPSSWGHVTGELLTQCQRYGVLQMCAADLDDAVELLLFGRQCITQVTQRGQQALDQHAGPGDMHCGGKGIVRGLRHVDVVVGMDRILAAHLAARELDRPVGDHLVGVHVGLCSAAGLPDV